MALSSTLLKAVAFVAAPKTSLIVSHPVRGTAAVIAARAARRAAPPRLGTALAVLAGATALPFVLRALKGRRHDRPSPGKSRTPPSYRDRTNPATTSIQTIDVRDPGAPAQSPPPGTTRMPA